MIVEILGPLFDPPSSSRMRLNPTGSIINVVKVRMDLSVARVANLDLNRLRTRIRASHGGRLPYVHKQRIVSIGGPEKHR
jgi:hypothetical protein